MSKSEYLMDKVSNAIIFATSAHEGQKRKGTEIPYIFHPLEAGIIATQVTSDQDIICATILHDILEDTSETYESITNIFGDKVANYVSHESEDKSKTWQERKSATLEQLELKDDMETMIITLCDKLSNIRAIHRDYANIGNELWKRFNVKDKDKQGWYYLGLVKGLKKLEYTEPYKEFARLVNEVFG